MNAPTVYLAARAGRQGELRVYARDLADRGWEVTSRWLWREGARSDESRMTDHQRGQLACECRDDVYGSATLIAFTEAPDSPYARGGRHVELGMALGIDDIRIIVCGPTENVFCCLPEVEVYPTWQDVLQRLGAPPQVTRQQPGGPESPMPGCKHHRFAAEACPDCQALLADIEEHFAEEEGDEA